MKLLNEDTLLSVEEKLGQVTGCYAQHTGWSCNSCFHTIIEEDYGNKLKEDVHRYWLAVLFFRGDYLDYDWGDTDTSNFTELIEELNQAIQ